MKNTICILAAFIVGQAIQIGAQAFGYAIAISKPLLLCIGLGVVVTAAVCAGIALAEHTRADVYADLPEVFGDEDQTH